MIQVNYELKGRELSLHRFGVSNSPYLICSLFDVDIKRESEQTLSVMLGEKLIGIVRFDEVGYGIPVANKKET